MSNDEANEWVWPHRPLTRRPRYGSGGVKVSRNELGGNLRLQPGDCPPAGKTVWCYVPIAGMHSSNGGPVGSAQEYYRPTNVDLDLVRRLWPDIADPGDPPWPRVETELTVTGTSHGELERMNAPALLLLLDRMRAGQAKTPCPTAGWHTQEDQGATPPGAMVQGQPRKLPAVAEKEVSWNPNDPDYISAKDAVELAGKARPGFKYNDLNKVLKPDGPMRYMRNPDPKAKGPGSVQRKVHKDELSTWLDGLKRAATANERQGEDNTSNHTDAGARLYEKGFAEGHPKGYNQGYADVKQGKPYCHQPPFQDAPDDQYVHGQYEGWKKGYATGRVDSESGEPQKYGV